MNSKQLNIPFDISPGCEPYVNDFLLRIGVQKVDQPEEICKGGLVFKIGEKTNCNECARTCAGCMEMAINLGYANYEDIKHLIVNPDLLSPKYKEQYKQEYQ